MMSDSKNALAEKHFGLVHSCCKRFSGKGIEYEELFAAGCLGLSKALNNFDESRGLQFSTYAFPVIMGELKQLFRDGGSVKVSRSLKQLAQRVRTAEEDFTRRHGYEPSLTRLAAELDVSVEEISEAVNCTASPVSLTADYDEDGSPQLDIPVPDIQYELSERLSLRAAIDALEPNDRKMIQLRYYGNKTQTQIAKLMNMTQVQVSRREKKVLEFIRRKMLA